MRKATKKLQHFISEIADIGDSKIADDDGKIYYSKFDGSYLTRVNMETSLNFLPKNGITEQIQATEVGGKIAQIGFNPEEQKWYGWSHRAIYGFGVGSKCKKRDCAYNASNKENFAEQSLEWYGDTTMDDTNKENATVKEHTNDEGIEGVLVEYNYDDKVPNKSMRGRITSVFEAYPDVWGKGEWEAKTLEDAKQMAIDFADSVS